MQHFNTSSRFVASMGIALLCVAGAWAQNQSDSSGTTIDPNAQKTADDVYKYMIGQKDALRAVDTSDSDKAKAKFDEMKGKRRFDTIVRRIGTLVAMNMRGPALRTSADEWDHCLSNLQTLESRLGLIGLKSLPKPGQLFIRDFNRSLSLMRELTEEVARYIDLTETLIKEAQNDQAESTLKLIDDSIQAVGGLIDEMAELRDLQRKFANAHDEPKKTG